MASLGRGKEIYKGCGYPTLPPDSLWGDTRGLYTLVLSETGTRQLMGSLGRRCELIPNSSRGCDTVMILMMTVVCRGGVSMEAMVDMLEVVAWMARARPAARGEVAAHDHV